MGRRSKPFSAYEQKAKRERSALRNSPSSGVASLVANIVVYAVFGIFILLWYIIKSIFSHGSGSGSPNGVAKKPIFSHEKTIYDLSRVQLIFAFAIGIFIFLYVFMDFCADFGTDSGLFSSIFIAALLASLGGAFSGMVMYFFNLVFRKE